MASHSRATIALSATLLSAACSTVNVQNLPGDAAAGMTALVVAGQDAQRASDALGWGSTVKLQQLGAKPEHLPTFTASVCSPPFFASATAVKAFQAYNEQISDLAKAPDASLGAYLRSIRRLDEAIADIKKAPPPKDYATLLAELQKKCSPLLTRDLALDGQVQTQAVPLLGAVDAILKLLAIPTAVAQLVEGQKRAEAVKVYVLAHEPELNTALDALGKGGLSEVIQATRTYYARRALAHYADLATYRADAIDRPPATPLNTADVYAQLVVKYLKLQGVSGTDLIEDDKDGLRAAYAAFMKSVKAPNSDPLAALDGFLLALKNISDLGSAVSDYKKAIADVSGGS